MRKPPISFFVIGAARSGTTSIWRVLTSHPDVFQPEMKEPRFFAGNWEKGWDWYADLYEDAPAGAICGDFSPSYSNAPGPNRAARRIAEHYPDARILYMIRNPIECAISNWRMAAEIAGKTLPFGEAFQGEWALQILHRSMFFKQISQYRQHFSDEQIMAVPIEVLRQETPLWLGRIQAHLGLPEIVTEFPRANASDRKPNRPLAPETTPEERRAFLDIVRPDALAMLDYLDLPSDLWSLSPNSHVWTKGLAAAD